MMKSKISRLVRSLRSDSEGGALVEIAVTLPLVMLVMTGIFTFSIALYQKLQLAEAVSNAGHYLATSRGDHDPCASAVSAITSGAPALNSSNITVVMSLAGTTLPASCPGSGTTGASTTFSSAQGEAVLVQAGYPVRLNVLNMWGSGNGFGAVTLGAAVSEVIQ